MCLAEMRYKIHNKEMLIVMRGLREWQSLLIGLQMTPFKVITDHHALEYFTTKHLLNPRQEQVGRRAGQLQNDHHLPTWQAERDRQHPLTEAGRAQNLEGEVRSLKDCHAHQP